MKLLGIVITRNSGHRLSRRLDWMSEYCDGVYAINDRSTDHTRQVLRSHPLVKNEVTISADISDKAWHFDEGMLLNLCYKLAELYDPDWIVRIDDDERLLGTRNLRSWLAALPPSVVGVTFPRVSTWSDPAYPRLVPLMGTATSPQGGGIWRFRRDVLALKRVHNPRIPAQVWSAGAIVEANGVSLIHDGWDTLKKRVQRIDFYNELDPQYDCNAGVPYDRGLLFGFQRNDISGLLAEYERRLEAPRSAPS